MDHISTQTHCPDCGQVWGAHDFGVPKPYCPEPPQPKEISKTDKFFNEMDMQDLSVGHKLREAKRRMREMEDEIVAYSIGYNSLKEQFKSKSPEAIKLALILAEGFLRYAQRHQEPPREIYDTIP